MISEQLNSPTRTTRKKLLQGRVASILNARELVINVGTEGGVVAGMKFAILAEAPIPVNDPETGEVLDIIDREKVTVEAVEVRQKISICRTFRTTVIPAGPYYLGSLTLGGSTRPFGPPQVIEEDLKVQSISLPPPLSPEDSYVKINDRVIQVS